MCSCVVKLILRSIQVRLYTALSSPSLLSLLLQFINLTISPLLPRHSKLFLVWTQTKFVITVIFIYSVHCKCFTSPYSTNKCTVLLLCISLVISCYMFRLNCHHHRTDTLIIRRTAINSEQCWRLSNVRIENLGFKNVTESWRHFIFKMKVVICCLQLSRYQFVSYCRKSFALRSEFQSAPSMWTLCFRYSNFCLQ